MPADAQKESEIGPSQRKLKALTRLHNLPAKVSDGAEYNLHQYIIAGVTLDRVRLDLSGIGGSLADAVIDERAR